MLQAWNLLQFVGAVEVVSSELLFEGGMSMALHGPARLVADGGAESPQTTLSGVLADFLDDLEPDVRELVEGVLLRTGRTPEPFFEVPGPDDEVVAQAEVGWEEERVVIVRPDDAASAATATRLGWVVHDPTASVEDVVRSLEDKR